MALTHLQIWIQSQKKPVKYSAYFTADFNPKALTFSKTTKWSAAATKDSERRKQFTQTEGTTLNVELLLDSYEKGGNVLDQVLKLRALMEVDPDLGGHPPLCLLFWGNFGQPKGEIFQGVLDSLNENYTMFLPDGTPVRATVTCSFSEFRDNAQPSAPAKPNNQERTRVVARGDSLASIALDEYGDPNQWRGIADQNGIDDPLQLQPGQTLTIPAIDREAS